MEQLFNLIFGDLPRQGPGEREATLKALSFIPDELRNGTFLDIGCGNGAQSLVILENTEANVIGLDSSEAFVRIMLGRARSLGFDGRVKGIVESMHSIQLPNGSIDVLWCESAIYNITPELGLMRWKPLLKPGGYFVFTELCWVKPSPPSQIYDYWKKIYPNITERYALKMLIERRGYDLVANFPLPDSAWRDEYYAHLEKRLTEIEHNEKSEKAKALFNDLRLEMRMFDEFGEYYNYEFFVAKLR